MQNDKTIDLFLSPDKEFTPIPFWFWNDTLNEEKIESQMKDLKTHGIDAFVIHPRIGLPDNMEYMSDEFLHYVRFAVSKAACMDMKVILYDEGMYPSGSACGQVVKSDKSLANKCLVRNTIPAKNVVPAITPENEDMLICILAEKISKGKLLSCYAVKAGDTFTKEDLSDWYFSYYVMKYSGSTIRGIHYGEDDMQPNAPKAADILNSRAVDRFIELTHEKYYNALSEYFGNTIPAIFTDEPSPQGRCPISGSIAWTDDFLDFYMQYADITQLPLLWLNEDSMHENALNNYNQALNEILGDRFYGKISDWCKNHGIVMTGHPGMSNDIGHLKHFGIPCQDMVWRYVEPNNENALLGEHSTMGKCASDAARHRGIRRNGNEVLGCCGPLSNGWLMDFSEMKWYFNWLFARGTNLIYPHAFFYSVVPPRHEERPPDVGFNSYWWANYNSVATYIKRICYMLTDSYNIADTAFLCSAHDLPYVSPKVFYENQVDFNYLETSIFENDAEINNGFLTIFKQEYKNLVVEKEVYLTVNTVEKLKKCRENGINVITMFRYDGFINLERPIDILNYTKKDFLIYPANRDLRASTIIKDGKRFVLLFNEGEEKIVCEVHIENAAEIDVLNPMTGEIYPLQQDLLSIDKRDGLILYVKSDYTQIPLNNWTVNGSPVSLTDWISWQGFENFCGTVNYNCNVNIESFKKAIINFESIHEMLELTINGKSIGYFMQPTYEIDITEFLAVGNNTITASVTNSTAMKFSSDKPQSGTIGNVYLNVEFN